LKVTCCCRFGCRAITGLDGLTTRPKEGTVDRFGFGIATAQLTGRGFDE
jgi:hypothetical protein